MDKSSLTDGRRSSVDHAQGLHQPLLPHDNEADSHTLADPDFADPDQVEDDQESLGLLTKWGLVLHPDTLHFIDDSQALSSALGGSGPRNLFDNRLVLICAVSACLGGLLFGFDQGLVSIVLVMPQFLSTFPQMNPSLTSSAGFNQGVMTAMLELGAFLGALTAGFVADKYSRRASIAIGLVWFMIGSLIQTFSYEFSTLVWGRGIGGVGIGLLSSTAPMYVAEIAPPNIRGSLLILEHFMIVLGIVVMFYITYITRYISSDWSFRLPFLLQMSPGLLLACLLFLLPYSPRWLAGKGRTFECLQVLSRLRALPMTDPRLQAEWISIQTEAIHEQEAFSERHPRLNNRHSRDKGMLNSFALDIKRELLAWSDLFGPKVFPRTQIGIGIMFFQQFVGINALIYFSPTLFEKLGLDYEMRLTLSGWMNVTQLVAIVFSLSVFERLGRRVWLFVGSLGMTISHVTVAIMMARYSTNWSEHPTQAWIGVTCIFSFMLIYGISWGPIAWALPSEVHSSTTRSRGVALATCSNWICNFIIGLITPPMVQKTGYGAFVFLATFAALSGCWVYYRVPETKGKTLEQMDEIFGSSLSGNDHMAKAAISRKIMYGSAVPHVGS